MDLLAAIDTSTRLAQTTKRTYRAAVERFVAFARGDYTGSTVEHWRDSLAVNGLDATTVYKMVSAVKFVSRRCSDLGLAPDFARAAELPKRPSWTPKRAALALEVVRLFAVCDADRSARGVRDAALLRLLALVGLRRIEVERLTRGSYRAGKLRVLRKGGWEQVIVVDGETKAALEAWLAVRRGRPEDPMFTSISRSVDDRPRLGLGLHAGGVAHIAAQRAREAGIKRTIRPHALRHSFVTLALDAGVPAHRVMVAAGHRSLATTSRYIGEADAEATPIGDAIISHLGKPR